MVCGKNRAGADQVEVESADPASQRSRLSLGSAKGVGEREYRRRCIRFGRRLILFGRHIDRACRMFCWYCREKGILAVGFSLWDVKVRTSR